MMERLREGVNGIAVKIILGLIIFSFLFAGVGGFITAGNVEPAALVGQREISVNQFEQAYQNERQQMETQSGEMATALLNSPEYLSQFKRNVLDRMINQALLDQYVDELGFRVSETQIKQSIREIPSFSSNGIFNNDQYLAALRRTGLTSAQFADYIRQDLEREYLVNALQNSEFVLNNEMNLLHEIEAQTRSVRTLSLPLADFTKTVTITPEQKKAYYDQNAFRFLRPEQFKIEYVELSGTDLAAIAEITDEEAQTYYQANLTTFGTAERRKVRHIMIEGKDDAAEKEAASVLAQLNSGADFATLAKTHSDDTFSAEQGGELDWIEKGVMDPEFEKAAFSLPSKGSISEVVKSDFGFHVIQLDDVKPSDAKPFEEMRVEILKQLKLQQAAEKFYEQSSLLAEKAFELPDNLNDAAEAVGVKVKETDFVALNELTGVLANPAVYKVLGQTEVRDDGLNSEAIEVGPEHLLIVRVNEVRPEMVLPFSEVDSQVEAILLQEESKKAAQALLDTLIADLKKGDTSSLEKSGYAFSEEKILTRESAEQDVVALSYKMPTPLKGQSEYAQTQNRNGDLILVQLDDVQLPKIPETDLKGANADKMLNASINSALSSVIGQLKEKIDVVYSLDSNKE